MKPEKARTLLCALSAIVVPLYLFTIFVALVTSGSELFLAVGAWYAALVPLGYMGLTGAFAFGFVRWRIPKSLLVVIHLAVVPGLMFSFLQMGLLLPVFAALFWWAILREQIAAPA